MTLQSALCWTVLICSAPAWASARQNAKAAYREGLQAEARGDAMKAAEAFARSDAAFKDDRVFEKALRAAGRTDISVFIIYLLSAAEGRKLSPYAAKLVKHLEKLHRPRVGKIQVSCEPDPTCSVAIRDRILTDGQSAFIEVGTLTVTVTAQGETQTRDIQITSPGPTVVMGLEAPPPAPALETRPAVAEASAAPQARSPSMPIAEPDLPGSPELRHRASRPQKLISSPVVVWVGVGLSAALATSAIISGVDTRGRYDQFLKTRSVQDRTVGMGAQGRTNLLWVTTGVITASTVVAAIFLTDWSAGNRSVAVVPTRDGAMVAMETPW